MVTWTNELIEYFSKVYHIVYEGLVYSEPHSTLGHMIRK